MNKVKLDTIKPWIGKRITELLGMEDDVVEEFVNNQLEADTVSKFIVNYTYKLQLLIFKLFVES